MKHPLNSITFVVLLLLSFTSCTDSRKEQEQQADKRLQHIQELINQCNYNAARLEIDSLHQLFPRLVNKRKVAAMLKDTVIRRECARNIAFCDSILPLKMRQADSLQKNFAFEKDKKYQDVGNYVYKTQRVEGNTNRTYLKCFVDENADFFMVSTYAGGRIDHESVKVSVNDSYLNTDTIPITDAANHTFTDGGSSWQTLTFKNEADNGVAAFITAHATDRIKVELIGKKKYIYYLDANDKKAIAETYQLWQVRKDIKHLQFEIRKAGAQIYKITNHL